MAIFKCNLCPKIKSGQPWKASGQYPMICNVCEGKDKLPTVTPIRVNQDKPILRLKKVS